MKKEQEIAAVKEELKRKIKKKGQELAALKVELKREKEQEIAAMKVDFRRQVNGGEPVTEKKLAEQRKERKVCCNISIIQFMYYMMCPYLVSGVYQQDEGDGGVTGEADTRDGR